MHKTAQVAIGPVTHAPFWEIHLPDAESSEPVASTAASADEAHLWFLASFPPPIDGQKICNAAMLACLSQHVATHPLELGCTVRGKVVRAIANAWTLLRHARADSVAYVSIPGQMGAWLLLPAVMALRLSGTQTWFHHHSFRSINLGPMTVMRALVACAGPNQNHILLADGMRDRFAALYLSAAPERAHTLSNTCLFPPDTRIRPGLRPKRPPTLGHMSVLTREKGVFYLLSLFDELVARVTGIRLILAGPVRDAELAAAIAASASRHPDAFDYRGAISGEEKTRFFDDIDLFVLPTTLVDEAEPLVMIEAYAQGVDVFATATGCIPDRLRDPGRTLTLNGDEDVEMISRAAAMTQVEWDATRGACHDHVMQLAEGGARQGGTVIAMIAHGACPAARPGNIAGVTTR